MDNQLKTSPINIMIFNNNNNNNNKNEFQKSYSKNNKYFYLINEIVTYTILNKESFSLADCKHFFQLVTTE